MPQFEDAARGRDRAFQVWGLVFYEPVPRPGSWIVKQLARSTSGGAFIPEVDGLRFLAILGVLIVHTAGDLYFVDGVHEPNWSFGRGLLLRLMGGGWFGVQIFFVLSGFIVTLPFARHALAGATPPDLKRYLLRRVTRIEPPYILALTAYFLAAGAASGNLSELAGHYAAGLVYSHQYIFETLNPVAQFTWSLEVEVVFYLLAPWLTRIYRIPGNYPRWALQAVLILLTACVAVFRLVPQGPARIENTLVVMIQYFLAGMLLADLYACGLLRRSTQWIWDAAALAGVFGLGAILSGMPGNWRYYWLTPLLIMVLFAGVMRGRFVNRFFRLPAVTIIGGMCYTLYLWHMAAIGLLVYRFKPWLAGMPDWAATVSYCALALPVMVLLCVPIYLLVEKPFMNGAGSRWLEGVMLPYTASRPTSL